MTLTDITALTGLLIAIAALLWNIIRDISDRGNLKIDGMIGKIVPSSTNKNFFFLTISNIGRRPVMVKCAYGKFNKPDKDGKRLFVIVPENLPKMLKEGEYIIENYALDSLNPNTKYIYIVDSCGRKYYLSRKRLKQLIKENAEQKII